jgi:hypothetical protein
MALQGWIATSAFAEGRSYYLKRGISLAQHKSDQDACIAFVKKDYFEPARAKMQTHYQPGLAGAAVTGFFDGIERGKIKREALRRTGLCLEKKGYRVTKMTPRQLEIFNSLSRDQHDKALALMGTGRDISSLAAH